MAYQNRGAVFPPHWAPQADPIMSVRLPCEGDEFAAVAARCIDSADVDVHEVYRVQNPTLYERFALRRAQLAQDYGGPAAEGWEVDTAAERGGPAADSQYGGLERVLWHGTDHATAEKIARRGFNRSFSRRAAFGKGNYFARHAEYSAQPIFAKRDARGRGVLLLARVLCSDVVQGTPDMIESPAPGVCAADRRDGPTIFVSFDDDCAYCAYCVVFAARAGATTCSPRAPRPGITFGAGGYAQPGLARPPPAPAVPPSAPPAAASAPHAPRWAVALVPANQRAWRPPSLPLAPAPAVPALAPLAPLPFAHGNAAPSKPGRGRAAGACACVKNRHGRQSCRSRSRSHGRHSRHSQQPKRVRKQAHRRTDET